MTSTLQRITPCLRVSILFPKFVPLDSSPITECIQGKQEMSFLETASVNSRSPSAPSSVKRGEAVNSLHQKTGTWKIENQLGSWEVTQESITREPGGRTYALSDKNISDVTFWKTALIVNSQALSLIS